MHLNEDVSSALQHMENVKKVIEESDDAKLQMQTADSLKLVLDILHDPVFRTMVNIQDSLAELNAQLAQHPSMLPNDFDIDLAGNLVLSVNGGDICYEFDERLSNSNPLSPRSLPSSPGSNIDLPNKTLSPLALDAMDEQSSVKLSAMSCIDLFAADYAQIQAIELVNDGTGLGFGIIGARTSGVIVKTILPGGVADRDGRLRSGDHILQIGDVNLHDMVSEQVAAVLRQSGTHVRLVVARPIEQLSPTARSTNFMHIDPGSAIVPTRVLVEPAELERYLISTGFPEIFGESSTASTPQTVTEDERFIYRSDDSSAAAVLALAPRAEHALPGTVEMELMPLPETEKLQVELTKDINGLGITIAGYVCEKEELSGIFVKSVSPGSAADLSGRIRVNDRIIEVDGQSLQGFSNHQAVELLKKSGHVVNLRLERYLRGPKYEQLQQAIAANDKLPTLTTSSINITNSLPPTPVRVHRGSPVPPITPQRTSSIASAARLLVSPTATITTTTTSNSMHINNGNLNVLPVDENALQTIAAAVPTFSTFGSGKKLIAVRDSIDGTPKIIPTDSEYTEDNENVAMHVIKSATTLLRSKYQIEPELTNELKTDIIAKWKKIVGPDVSVIVAQIKKFAVGGLGISLEGTVDVEGGREVRPHHYIRSILADGPVGLNGVLRSGDELLEVNGERLLGMNHLEVVAILKELPQDVRMVCGRSKHALMPFSDDTLKKLNSNFENLLPASDRLVKAKSDGSLATTGCTADDTFSNKLKSRSLEPLTGLAMWSSEPQIIELVKGDRGLGFSILDYQDPLDPNDTLIVIRSLVPGGVAQLDGRLIPGDRLLFVNSINLENASLDQAVQALKGAPKGIVRIGVAKPLPMTDNTLKNGNNNTNNNNNNNNDVDNDKTTDNFDNTSTTSTINATQPDLLNDWRH